MQIIFENGTYGLKLEKNENEFQSRGANNITEFKEQFINNISEMFDDVVNSSLRLNFKD